MNNKPKPDDRSNNVERIQKSITMTIHSMELADEMIDKTDDEKMKQALKDKNDRRRDALRSMRYEIADEAQAMKNKKK